MTGTAYAFSCFLIRRIVRPGRIFILALRKGNPPPLVLVAAFIFLAASGEAGYVEAREYTRGYLASHAMITAYQPLNPNATADDAAYSAASSITPTTGRLLRHSFDDRPSQVRLPTTALRVV